MMRKILPVALCVIALLFSGCSNKTIAPANTITPVPTPAEVKNGINTQEANHLKGGNLRLVMPAMPKTWNRCHKDAPQGKYHNPLSPLQPNVFNFDNTGKAEANKLFIKEIKTTDEHVKISLNPAATWQNGSPIKAEDWLQTWEVLNGSNKSYEIAAECDWSNLKEFQIDKVKDEISFTVSNQENWQMLLAQGPLPKAGIATAEAFNSGWNEPKPEFFAGPFSISHVDPELVTEIANPNYPRKALLNKITFRVVDLETWPLAFQKNEVDAIYLGATAPIQTLSLSQFRSNGTTNLQAVALNPDLPLPIRQVISAVIDPAALTPANANSARNLIFLPQQEGYQNSANRTGLIPNLSTAQDILTSLGYQYLPLKDREAEKKYWQLDGKPLTLVLPKLPDEIPLAQKQLQEQITKQLKDFGIDILIADDKKHPKADLELKVIELPPDTLKNALNYDSQILNSLASLADPEYLNAQNDLLNQVADKAWLEAKVIPLYQLPEFALTKNNLANYGAFGLSTIDWSIIGWQ